MKRWSVFLLVVLLGVAAVFFAQSLHKTNQSAATNEGNLVLTNMPSQYCPSRAWLVITKSEPTSTILDRDIKVSNCRYISLSTYLSDRGGEYTVYARIPNALAFRFEVSSPLQGVVEYPVQLGDINNDNVIDASDEKLATQYLFSDSVPKLDVTGDKSITIDDVSLIRLNQGIGVARPDKTAWAKGANE